MSRCFPFPPPGYEKKITSSESDLLKKEKQKEKKLKKDKDKEKKESKEKHEKDKKEKHKDKKKDKHRGDGLLPDDQRTLALPQVHVHKLSANSKERGNDRNATSSEKRVAALSAFNNRVPVSKNNDLASESKTKYASELGTRSTDEDRTVDQFPYKLLENSKEMGNDRKATSSEKRVAVLSAFNNREPVSKNNHLASESKTKYASELGTRSTDEGRTVVPAERKKDEGALKTAGATPVLDGKGMVKGKPAFDGRMDVLGGSGVSRLTGNTLGPNSVGVVKRPRNSAGPLLDGRDRMDKLAQISPGVVKLHVNNVGSLVDGRERKEKPTVDARRNVRAVSVEASSSGSVLPSNSLVMAQNRVGARPIEKKVEEKAKAKGNIIEEGDDIRGDKRKEKEGEKVLQKDREKDTKKEEKIKVAEHVQMTRLRDGSENHVLETNDKVGNEKEFSGAQSIVLNIPTINNQGGATLSNNFRKRKDIGQNGTYDEFKSGPNKLAKTAASTHPLSENGKSLELCQNAAAVAPGTQRLPMNIKVERTFAPDDTQRPPMNIKVDGKQRKINGIKDEFTQSSRTIAKAERKSDAPAKPHPDTKYLSQVLTVPKMDEWAEFDDQEWLFNNNSSQTGKPKFEPSGIDKSPKVWSKGLWLEPDDVFALPYVVPH